MLSSFVRRLSLALSLSLSTGGVRAQTTAGASGAGGPEPAAEGEILVTGSREANATISGLTVDPVRLTLRVEI